VSDRAYSDEELREELGTGPYAEALLVHMQRFTVAIYGHLLTQTHFQGLRYRRVLTNKSNQQEVEQIEANVGKKSHRGGSHTNYMVSKQKKYPRPGEPNGQQFWLVRVKKLLCGSKVIEEKVTPNSQLSQAEKHAKQDGMRHQKPSGAGQKTLSECRVYMEKKGEEKDLSYNRAQGHIGTWRRRARLCDLVETLTHYQTATSLETATRHVCSAKKLHKALNKEWANISREIVKS